MTRATTIPRPKRKREVPETGDIGKPHPGRRMTEIQFVEWVDEFTRAEWVDGEVVIMAPVSTEHWNLNAWLTSLLRYYVDQHDLGIVGGSELSIRLPKQRQRRVPDVAFVRKDRLKIMATNHVEGAPDLIIEIVSPDSESRDWREKFLAYQSGGVREYWIVDPMSKHVEAYVLKSRRFAQIEEVDGRIPSQVVKGFFLKPNWLWAPKLPKVPDVVRELGIR